MGKDRGRESKKEVLLGTWLLHSLANSLAASPEATSRLRLKMLSRKRQIKLQMSSCLSSLNLALHVMN